MIYYHICMIIQAKDDDSVNGPYTQHTHRPTDRPTDRETDRHINERPDIIFGLVCYAGHGTRIVYIVQ